MVLEESPRRFNQADMKALAECRCWSLTPHAEDVIVVLLRRVTSEASGDGVLADHRAGWVACGETFKAPAAGSGKPLAVLLHYAEHLTLALGDRVVGSGRFQHVEDDDRAVSKRSRSVAFQGGLVGVDVMYPAKGTVKLVSGLNHHALDVRPVAITRRIIDLRLAS